MDCRDQQFLRIPLLLDRIFQKNTVLVFLRDFHTGESSESLRQVPARPSSNRARYFDSIRAERSSNGCSDGMDHWHDQGVDGHPSSALSLQDKLLLRKYSIPVSIGTSITTAEGSLVQSERDGCTIRSEGPQKAEYRAKVGTDRFQDIRFQSKRFG